MKSKKAEAPRIQKLTVTLPADMLDELDRIARAEHRSRSGQVQFFLSNEVARRTNSSERATA